MDIYKNSQKFLVLKISWELIDGADFDSFAQYIKELKNSWIPIILVYWWWGQITSKYKELTKKDRPKWKDWLNYTSKLLIRKGVNPAYKELKKKLEDIFWIENINAFDKGYILWNQITQLWEVWTVKSFLKPFSKDKINIVPFVWMNESTWCTLNINADDVVNKIVTELKDKISNITFLTWTWWIKYKDKKIVPFLTMEKVEKILKWENTCISVDWWMQKKLLSILDLLKKGVSKVTIASLEWLKEELEWFGSGTMIINLEKAKFGKLSNKGLFEMIYKKNVKSGYWKARNKKQKNEIFKNYTVLEIDWTVLGWYALSGYKDWKLLECIFSFKSGGGIWTKLWEEIKKEKKVYAYSKNGWFFEKLWFEMTPELHPVTWSNLFVYEKKLW